VEKEGGSLVDRPWSIVADELPSNGMRITMARSGERFGHLQTAVCSHLQPKAVELHQDMQHENPMNFILDLLNDEPPEALLLFILSTTVSFSPFTSNIISYQ
jgi:hypothetical protein